jgi:MoaA/NifB/PqqE/SkfB family radical SAM enzyme
MKINNFEYISQLEYWNYYLNESDAVDLLKYNIPNKKRIKLFNKYVMVVNIETSSYCNRVCDYCPVTNLESKTKEFMSNEKFDVLIKNLEELNYSNIITLNLFNEPLASFDNFISRLEMLKNACPNSYIRMNSNGDYLTKDKLIQLKNAGMSEILVTMHTQKNEVYDDKKQQVRLDDFINKLELNDLKELTNFEENKNISYEIKWEGVRILAVSNNWGSYGNDRGGELEKLSVESRDTPCLVPFREIVVDYNGLAVICWNVFRNISNKIGQIGENGLIDIYFDKAAVDLRREMLVDGPKKGIHRTCNVPSYTNFSTSENRKRLLFDADKS